MTTRDVRVAVYGDVNLNIIDGSAIWLQSIATVLARIPRVELTVVLKAREERVLLTQPLRELAGVTVVNPVDEGWYEGPELSRNQALDALEKLDRRARFDAFVLRGFSLCHMAATRKRRQLVGRLWPYLTDIPQSRDALDTGAVAQLTQVADASRYLLCQTEPLRCFLESYVPAAAGRAVLLTPMIPDELPAPTGHAPPLADGAPLRLVYVGKYAPMWNTYEMTQAVASLRREGLAVELHMVGDKIHRDRADPTFHERMDAALRQTDGVHWHQGKSRQDVLAMLPQFHVALGWRDARLDDSLELSTKLLEYGAGGVPAIVNRNSMHEQLLGADYPLFANTAEDFCDALRSARDAAIRAEAATRCKASAGEFSFARVADRLAPWVDRAVPRRDLGAERPRPLRLLVASHDFKFFTRIQEHLSSVRGLELRADVWPTISDHDAQRSEELLQWADVIVCEWCANTAIWYSQRKKSHQRLIVRLHRFELYGRYPTRLAFDRVDRMVFVGDYYRDEAISRLGWDRDKLAVIPNWVDTELLDRPKAPGAFFRLGMIGIAPMRKRLDRGIDVLERVRRVDDRFQLYVKTKLPWDYPWIWAKADEKDHYREVFRRINATESLRGAVHFDPFGPDVGAWLRKIGFVLSTSDDESFHLAPAEGMASGALPLFLPWQGADAIYPSEWVLPDEQAIADKILAITANGTWTNHGEQVKQYIRNHYSVERVCRAWEDLVLG